MEDQTSKFIYEKDIVFEKFQSFQNPKKKLIQEKLVFKSGSNWKIQNQNRQVFTVKDIEHEKNDWYKLKRGQTNNAKKKSRKTSEERKNIFQFNSTLNQEILNNLSASLINTSYPGVEIYTQYATARLRLSSLTNVESLNSRFGPVINDVLSFEYPISISPCLENRLVKRSVFVAVISAPSNWKKRNIIRKTWKNHLKILNSENIFGIVGFAFILGLPENYVTQHDIIKESKMYEDIIQIRMSDFYRNLSLKVAGLLNWLNRMCTKIDFVLKVDDDVYVNVRNVAHFVKSYHQSKYSIFGVGDPSGGWPDRGINIFISEISMAMVMVKESLRTIFCQCFLAFFFYFCGAFLGHPL
jgi:hypothetical protein